MLEKEVEKALNEIPDQSFDTIKSMSEYSFALTMQRVARAICTQLSASSDAIATAMWSNK